MMGKTAAMKILADNWARDHPGGKMAWVTSGKIVVTEVRGELVKDDQDGVFRLKDQEQE